MRGNHPQRPSVRPGRDDGCMGRAADQYQACGEEGRGEEGEARQAGEGVVVLI